MGVLIAYISVKPEAISMCCLAVKLLFFYQLFVKKRLALLLQDCRMALGSFQISHVPKYAIFLCILSPLLYLHL